MCTRAIAANLPPVADAGSSRYAGTAAVRLDGTKSYDPDESTVLTYAWTQVSGPSVIITEADTATPTISGFAQTDQIQECEFELAVGDGDLTGEPKAVKIVIVPGFIQDVLRLWNASFDTEKPTIVYFGGGDCTNGMVIHASCPLSSPAWLEKANVISFPEGYVPDVTSQGTATYFHMADMIIVYLSSVAPDYAERIQAVGWSTGAQPAADVAIRLNHVYADARYAVNRVTHLDGGCRILGSRGGSWGRYAQDIDVLLSGSPEEEQCWVDHYWGVLGASQIPQADILAVYLTGYDHTGVRAWYSASLTEPAPNKYSHGLVAGAYWSVIGPGRNLQQSPAGVRYFYQWQGNVNDGGMTLYDQSRWPSVLPEPVRLAAWASISNTSGDRDGAVLSCYESENAVGYEVLLGSNRDRVAGFTVISDTPTPPMAVVRDFPYEETWWTIRVRDQNGSTIHADPVLLDLIGLAIPTVQNTRTGKRYALIGHAILDAYPDDTILLSPAIYTENIEFTKPLIVSSVDPSDPLIVAETVIKGQDTEGAVIFRGAECAGSTLAGLTIQSDTTGVSCRNAGPVIKNCVVECPNGIAIEYWYNRSPRLVDCSISGEVNEGGDPGLIVYWTLDEKEGSTAYDSIGEQDAALRGQPRWLSSGGMIRGALEFDGTDDYVETPHVQNPLQGPFSIFAWVKDGGPGQVIVSQQGGTNWLMASGLGGALITELKKVGRNGKPLTSESAIADGVWHRVGCTWDGSGLVLYVDDVEVARDTQADLVGLSGNLMIGVGSTMASGSFWKGAIDDVRVYDRAVKP
jgi:hypothetical protein